MKRSAKIGFGVVGALLAIQLVSCERTNPPITGDIPAPPDVKLVLRRACYDCHSNETTWPWYSRVAPVSWLLHRDVVQGRRHLNFSEWSSVPVEKRAKKRKGIAKQVDEGEMPLWFYVAMHPQAKLTDEDKKIIDGWAASATDD